MTKIFLSDYENLSLEWHQEKNGDLKSSEILHRSGKKVWWRCKNGHEFQAIVSNRTQGSGCPFCTGKRASLENNLQIAYPNISKEWNFEKNGVDVPKDFTPGSSKKVWWQCQHGHDWQSSIAKRTSGQNCPFCARKRASIENNLVTCFPKLMSEWNIEKNKGIEPTSLLPQSHKIVWWRCRLGHEWKTKVQTRVLGSGCPFCSNKKVGYGNDLKTEFPNVAADWDYQKNGKKGPEKYVSGSHTAVWWKCEYGHEWKAQIKSRTSGSGCPKCSNQTSRLELRILAESKFFFDDVKHREKISGNEIDIFFPEIKLGIEIDGWYYHKGKKNKDNLKQRDLEEIGISLLRVRELPLEKVNPLDVQVGDQVTKKDMNQLFSNIILPYHPDYQKLFNEYVEHEEFVNIDIYQEYISYLPRPLPGTSFLDVMPKIADEWHRKKNAPLTAGHFTIGSNHSAWWKCKNGHIWNSKIKSRANGSGCPFCSRNMITYESSFGAKHSSLLNEWDYNSNNISPFEIGETSEIKVNWKCLHKHIWNSSIHNRVTNKLGCPTCEVKEIERGKWWGGTVPFGYVLNETKLEIDQKNASYVRMIYDEIRNGKSTLDVFRTFQSLNVQTARGKNFQYSSLKNLVSNTHYVGFYIYKSRRDGLLHKGSSPQLVAFDDWMFANRKKTFSREVSRILQLTRKVD